MTIWAVRVGNGRYVRSAHRVGNGWFRRAKASGAGRVRAGGIERDVSFGGPDENVCSETDAAYHREYDRYGPSLVGIVVGHEVAAVTLRLDPRPTGWHAARTGQFGGGTS